MDKYPTNDGTSKYPTDKGQESLNDAIIPGISHCCSARVYQPDICKACGEHCEVIQEENE